MKAKELLPTQEEGRKLILQAWQWILLAVLGIIPVTFLAARGWLGAHAHDLWLLGSRDIPVRGWVLLSLFLCALCGVIQLLRWLTVSFRDSHVRLFRSLSRDEQSIIRVLANCEFGISEGDLSKRVPAPNQRFFYFIDHLVHRLRLVERTEPSTGGAFWFLSQHGREVAIANHLFDK